MLFTYKHCVYNTEDLTPEQFELMKDAILKQANKNKALEAFKNSEQPEEIEVKRPKTKGHK